MAGKSKKGSKRLLDLRGNIWWFKRDIPLKCRPHFDGKTSWMRSLETSDLRIAIERRDILEAETARMFADMRSGRWKGNEQIAPSYRGSIQRAYLAALSDNPDSDDGEVELARYSEEAEREALRGTPRREYEDALKGRVSVDHYLAAYLAIAKLSPKVAKARQGLINQFARWCSEEKLTLDRVDRRVAGRYVAQRIDPMHPVTAYAHVLALRHYWIYLHARGHVSNGDDKGGPWVGQLVKDKRKRVERGSRLEERAFTSEEVIKLVQSPFPPGIKDTFRAQIVDALKISLLSGMRLSEVLTLWVEEVHDGVFDIQQGKTDAAARQVPIHPDLAQIIQCRTKGKGPKEWLFHELKNERDPVDTFGKRFRRYRVKVGVDEKAEGKRRSLVNFHSARRWFITSARHAGHPKETVADVVGHIPDKKDITFGVYTQGASQLQRKQCVESVRLPQ